MDQIRNTAMRLVRRARRADNAAGDYFDAYMTLYEQGQRAGWPVNKITAAIVASGYSVSHVAYQIGSSAVKAISHLASKYADAFGLSNQRPIVRGQES